MASDLKETWHQSGNVLKKQAIRGAVAVDATLQ
jgi:hypothetical protein